MISLFQPEKTGSYAGLWLAGALVFCIVLAVFWPPADAGFLNCDDNVYVSENAYVLQGLTLDSARWAFTHVHESYWAPLTWLSYMVDLEIYGLDPWGIRLTNALLHAANAVLLFFLMVRLVGNRMAAFLAVLLFSLHPLRVESVAWISERKDVLSAFFGLWAIHAYLQYVSRRSWLSYAAICVCFGLSLMAKPMLVTLPAALLVLDFWPLRRTEGGLRVWRGLIVEKIPLFAISAVLMVLTVVNQGGAVHGLAAYSWTTRLEGFVGALAFYIGKILWPGMLSIAYEDAQPGVLLGMALAIALMGGTYLLWRSRTRVPALWCGWAWFLIILAPVAGLVRVGTVHVADRFTYAPSIGLALAAAWFLSRLFQKGRPSIRFATIAATLVLAGLAVMGTRQYLPLWSHDLTLFGRAVEVAPSLGLSRNNYGVALMDAGRLDEAAEQFVSAMKYWNQDPTVLRPGSGPAQLHLAMTLEKVGRNEDALVLLDQMVRVAPQNAIAHNNLAIVLNKMGRTNEAIESFQRAIAADPAVITARYNLGMALQKEHRLDEALAVFDGVLAMVPKDARAKYLAAGIWMERREFDRALSLYAEAVALAPQQGDVRMGYADALFSAGRREEAAGQYESLLKLDPDSMAAMNTLAWLYATAEPGSALDQSSRAIELAERAKDNSGGQEPSVLDTLATAYAAGRRLGDAIETSRLALELAEAGGFVQLAEEIRQRMSEFEQGRGWIDHGENAHKEG